MSASSSDSDWDMRAKVATLIDVFSFLFLCLFFQGPKRLKLSCKPSSSLVVSALNVPPSDFGHCEVKKRERGRRTSDLTELLHVTSSPF